MATIEEMRLLEQQAAQNGKSIEDLAEEQGIDLDAPDPEVYIEGTSGQLSLTVGGRKPDSATFKMKGAEVKVRDGQYTKGEMVTLKVMARIDEIKFVDSHDEYGTVTASKRVHIAKPIHVTKVEEDEASQ